MNLRLLHRAGFAVALASLSLAVKAQTNLNLSNPTNSANLQVAPGTYNVHLDLDSGNAITSSASYNTLIGASTGLKINSGDFNVGVGYFSLLDVVTNSRNTALGAYSGFNTVSDDNVFVGHQSGYKNGTGSRTVSVGFQAGYANRTGDGNVSIGYLAAGDPGATRDTEETTVIGDKAGSFNTGSRAVMIGTRAGYNNTGDDVVIVGQRAGYNNTAPENIFVGAYAGQNITTGNRNTVMGYLAGAETTNTGNDNSYFGYRAGYANTTGDNNFFMGAQAGEKNTSGGNNLFLGTANGRNNISGQRNVFIGASTGAFNTFGSRNTFVGELAGYVSTTGTDNTFLGRESGVSNTTGSYNLYIGRATGSGLTAGYANTFIGDAAGSNNASTQYSTALGEGAKVDCNSCLVLGRAGVNTGINVTAPAAKLHVNAAGSSTSGIRFQNLPTAVGGTIYRLYVDSNGNVFRNSGAGAREGSESTAEANWTITPDNHLVNSNLGSVMIGTGLSSTPAGYKLYVSEGILTERVKVAVKSTSEWRDNVLQDDYKLRSVEEVETFIKANKHLPGVPSAQEMVENGNDLQKTDAVLLEKVEEMMLYIIELKKENSSLKSQIEGIERQLTNKK